MFWFLQENVIFWFWRESVIFCFPQKKTILRFWQENIFFGGKTQLRFWKNATFEFWQKNVIFQLWRENAVFGFWWKNIILRFWWKNRIYKYHWRSMSIFWTWSLLDLDIFWIIVQERPADYGSKIIVMCGQARVLDGPIDTSDSMWWYGAVLMADLHEEFWEHVCSPRKVNGRQTQPMLKSKQWKHACVLEDVLLRLCVFILNRSPELNSNQKTNISSEPLYKNIRTGLN